MFPHVISPLSKYYVAAVYGMMKGRCPSPRQRVYTLWPPSSKPFSIRDLLWSTRANRKENCILEKGHGEAQRPAYLIEAFDANLNFPVGIIIAQNFDIYAAITRDGELERQTEILAEVLAGDHIAALRHDDFRRAADL